LVKEMSLEEFKNLSEVQTGRKIVDWEEVLRHFSGKVVLFEDVKKYVEKKYGKYLWYSEWRSIAERYALKKGFVILTKKRLVENRVRRLWYIEVIQE